MNWKYPVCDIVMVSIGLTYTMLALSLFLWLAS